MRYPCPFPPPPQFPTLPVRPRRRRLNNWTFPNSPTHYTRRWRLGWHLVLVVRWTPTFPVYNTLPRSTCCQPNTLYPTPRHQPGACNCMHWFTTALFTTYWLRTTPPTGVCCAGDTWTMALPLGFPLPPFLRLPTGNTACHRRVVITQLPRCASLSTCADLTCHHCCVR